MKGLQQVGSAANRATSTGRARVPFAGGGAGVGGWRAVLSPRDVGLRHWALHAGDRSRQQLHAGALAPGAALSARARWKIRNQYLLWAGASARNLPPRDPRARRRQLHLIAALRTSRFELPPANRLVMDVEDLAEVTAPKTRRRGTGSARCASGGALRQEYQRARRCVPSTRAIALDSLFAPAYIPCIRLNFGRPGCGAPVFRPAAGPRRGPENQNDCAGAALSPPAAVRGRPSIRIR